MSDKIEEKKVNPETVENIKEAGIESPEAVAEKESKTMDEEVKKNADVVKDAEAAMIKQQAIDLKTLETNEIKPDEVKDFDDGKKVINVKLKTAEEIYEENIEKLKDIPDAEDKIEGIKNNNCSICGAEIREGAKFCIKCGNKLVKEKSVEGAERAEKIIKPVDGKIARLSITTEEKEAAKEPLEELLKKSEVEIEGVFEEFSAYNKTIPNRFKRLSEGLNNVLNKTKEDGADKETVNFLITAIMENRKKMIGTIKDESYLFDSNPGKDQIGDEKINIDSYNGIIKTDELKKQFDEIDKELTEQQFNFDVSIFSKELSSAISFLEIAENAKNIKEKHANLIIAKYIFDNLKNALGDRRITGALGDKRSKPEEKSDEIISSKGKEKAPNKEKNIDLEKLSEWLNKETKEKIMKEFQDKESPLSKIRKQIKQEKFEINSLKDLISEREIRIKKRLSESEKNILIGNKRDLEEKKLRLTDMENNARIIISNL